jgi:oligopeptide transport system substrate-binding protein
MAINRDIIGTDIWGTGEPVAYSVVPPGTANYEGTTPYRPEWADWPYEQRVAEAKKILEAAGYTAANPLKLQLKYNTNDNHQRLAVAISAMWQEIGIQAELFNSETPVHYDSLEAGDFQVGRAGWLLDYSDASNILELFKTGTDNAGTINWGNNYSRFSDPKFDELMNQAAAESDLLKRAGLLNQAEAIAMEGVAVIPLVYYLASNVVKPNIKGFEDNPKDVHRTRWLTKE